MAAGEVRFGGFALDADNALLVRGRERVDLPPKAFAVLCHLAQRPGQLVTKDDLLDAVWGHRFVSESVLKTAINAIRAAVGDDAREPRVVETVPRRGYRFIATLESTAAPAAAVLAPPAGSRTEQPEVEDDAPWVGRDGALARLGEWLDAVSSPAGGRQLVLVGGEAGIGKSMLVDRFCVRVRAAGVPLAAGQCVEQQGGGEPFLPLLDAVAGLAQGPRGSGWSEALRQRAPAWHARLPWLAAGEGGAAAEPQQMLREFGALLDAMTAEQPLVLVLEDLHWSDNATVQLLGWLARRRSPARWLVVGSFRPTDAALADHPLQALRHELRAQRLAADLLLDAFSERDVDAYLERRFAPAGVAQRERLARELHERTEGLPLFVSHVVDELVQGGWLASDAAGGDWTLAPDAWQRVAVPETIAGLVERQIARLPGEWRALLEAAAVVGPEFAHDVLARVVGETEDALRARCDGLARRGEWLGSARMVERPDGRIAFAYGFRHAIYQRVLHARSEPAQRLQQHLAAARALESLAPHPAELAQHHEEAYRIAAASGLRAAGIAGDARRWRLAAAREARALHALADALAHYTQVLAFEPPPAERAAVQQERSELLRLTGRGDLALAEADAALHAAREAGDPALIEDVRLSLARIRVRCDHVPEGLTLADELLREWPAGDARRPAAWLAKADAHRRLGEHAAADAALEQAFALVPAGDDALRAEVLSERVGACFHRGAPGEGRELAREAQALYERCGQPSQAARMLIRVGVFAQALGQGDEAEAALLEGRRRMRQLGDIDGERGALLNLVKLYTDGGDAARALPLLEEGWALADGFESPVAEAAFLQGFYYCRVLRGELGAALADATRVLASADALNSLYWRVGAASLVSDLFIHLGDTARAADLVDGALKAMQPGGEQSLRPRLIARRAWLDVIDGVPQRALDRIATLAAEGPVEQLEDAVNLDRVEALARLARGDAQAALNVALRHDGAPTIEVWALLLAVRLRAQCQLGKVIDADLDRARREVGDPRLPALEGLVLRRALIEALAAADRQADAAAQRTPYEAQRLRMAASLDATPERRAAFLAAF